ncbi:polymer-forming cytoskeletal protein [Altererythrobacter indicus]|uniref:Polymer-forming cytoskeletal protein n=1 Tax=Altericroceibacterium indicum TaxID=374177 RepID=A0A845ABY9_9SPHN|nr:polymer-forming cytoskeletal protein [Altericroceibacterium indicum]MXP26511.1 polymer-forming cytoskeletal protein [Altericroceibacterium indicum]
MPRSGSTFSVIGADVVITGDLNASAEIHLDGQIKGDLACAALVQGESGVIEGSVTAESARLSGRITGSITASQVVILQSAVVEGDVFYDALTIEEGAKVDGRFAQKGAQKNESEQKSAELPNLTLANSN